MEIYWSAGEADTRRLAAEIAGKAHAGSVICLDGDLGAGKTVFSRGFCEALGVMEPVSSPTFTIVNEYEGREYPVYHFDMYRISDVSELYEIGFDEYLDAGGVCLIEWADNIRDALPENRLSIRIERAFDRGDDARKITLDGTVS